MPEAVLYPTTRLDRGDSATPLQTTLVSSAVSVPTTQVWPFRVGAGVINTRSIAVGGPFQGPAILGDLSLSWGTAATTNVSFALYWSVDGSGAGVNLPASTRPSGTPVFSPIGFQTAAAANTEEFKEFFDQSQAGFTNALPLTTRLRYYIPQGGAFFLKAMVRNGAAGTFDCKGIVTVIENVSAEQAESFF